ncbi:M23 family metallopeptidase [Tenacibaculum agarivorans]|uniref:M23 family metallopeptidase n=1 Tax=Tenacibaculum agarivorans TaxID=1908389 RepID=UPI0009FB24AD|nr:M23 family metallopeptidase [Tenacibaculum agarivorans]
MTKTLFFIFFYCLIQAQTRKELINEALIASNDTTAICTIKKGLKGNYVKYKVLFNYIPSINPLNPKKQKRISSRFGRRFHPIDGRYKQHLGLDIAAKIGTPIHAAASGVVKTVIKSNKGYGNQVFIDHLYGYSTRYAHMYISVVKKGQRIKKGDIIGFVGNTGKSTGPHLHFEILKNSKPIDPYPFCFLDI